MLSCVVHRIEQTVKMAVVIMFKIKLNNIKLIKYPKSQENFYNMVD